MGFLEEPWNRQKFHQKSWKTAKKLRKKPWKSWNWEKIFGRNPEITNKNILSSKGIPSCEMVDKFIDDLIEGVETKLPVSRHPVTLVLKCSKNTKAVCYLQWSSVIFVESFSEWPEFISNVYNRVHIVGDMAKGRISKQR